MLDRDGWWVRAVQWHPENLIALDPQRALWTDFVRAAGFDSPEVMAEIACPPKPSTSTARGASRR